MGRRKLRKKTTRSSKRDEENGCMVDSSSVQVEEEPVGFQPEQVKNATENQGEAKTTDFVFVDWNRLQWSTRKRKRNSKEESDSLTDHPIESVKPVVDEELFESCENSAPSVLEEERVNISADSREEEQQSTSRFLSSPNQRQVSFEDQKIEDTCSVVKVERSTVVESACRTKKPIIRRSKEEWKSRMQLPICEKEQEILEIVSERDIVFITAETGSGKTTQVPQFLYEAGYCCPSKDGYYGKIVITQPRRVAAFACSSRVARELHVPLGAEVGYHVRHFRKVSHETKIEFVTDGILLRLLQSDILLRRYSVVILDEAHERSMNADLILGLVTRSVRLRRLMFENNEKVSISGHEEKVQLPPLKFIVMSATLDVDVLLSNDKLFSASIPQPATLQVETRGYPVHIHFAKKTAVNYIEAAFKTVCKIHRQLPPGDVLVFLTGRSEVLQLCRKLSIELQGTSQRRKLSHQSGNTKLQSVRILPLYSMLPWKQQQRVFSAPQKDCRTIVIATNVAEISITIPNIVYVVDSGRVKKKEYICVGGQEAFSMIRFRIKWTSQSSAEQRAGRAGRICEGHCYRLYSAAVFLNELEEQEEPEIQRMPAEAVLLKLKALDVDVHNFPFPSPPSEEALEKAEKVLCQLGALDIISSTNKSMLSPLGEKLVKLPLSSRLGKLVVKSCDSFSTIAYAVRIASLLTVSDLFITSEEDNDEWQQVAKVVSRMDTMSEILSILYSFCAWEYSIVQNAPSQAPVSYGLRDKSVREVCLIINQLSRLLMKLGWIPEKWYPICRFPNELHPPMKNDCNLLIKTILGCFPDQVCRHLSIGEATKLGLTGRRKREAFETFCGRVVFLSRDRMLTQPVSSIEFLCYVELLDKSFTRSEEDDTLTKHIYIRNCSVVTSDMLVDVALSLCHFSQPLLYPLPKYDVDRGCVVCSVHVSYGPRQWPLGIFQVPFDDDKYSTMSNGSKYDLVMMDRYRVFAQSFLRGQVFQSLSKWIDYLKESPDAMIQSPSKPCVMQFYMELCQHKIYQKKDCVRMWEKRPSFLLKEYLNFLKDESSVISDISRCWPPV